MPRSPSIPVNMQIGYHTDWGAQLPLPPDGACPTTIHVPNPSLYLFGFQYDPVYTECDRSGSVDRFGPGRRASAPRRRRAPHDCRPNTANSYSRDFETRNRRSRDESAEEENPHESN